MNPKSEKLNKAFITAYQSRQEASISPAWQSRVMAAIRREARQVEPPDPWASLEILVWRLAPAACVLIAVMAAALMGLDMTSGGLVAETFMNESMETLLAQTVGG